MSQWAFGVKWRRINVDATWYNVILIPNARWVCLVIEKKSDVKNKIFD